MPSFLSKVFTRKKEDKEPGRSHKRSSVASLLEGKFEAVSPNISPSVTHFAESTDGSNGSQKEREREREKEKDKGFPLFRARSPRPVSPNPVASKSPSNVPHLTLNLPVPKEEKSRALGVVFEADPDVHSTLPDNIIGERRLSPLEALLLVKACSAAIVDHGGLETLGVMHPHWYSASPQVQRKLISLFILSLAPKSPITTLSPTSSSPLTIFNTELEYTRSPHDIAAVLRWALRHLRLDGDSFGTGGSSIAPWQWYTTFAETEQAKSYPPSAFSELLVPQLPPAHLQLLVATLEIVSSLAAHSEHNGISGSKLSKFFGLWLLMAKRSEDGDDWTTFYARWERAGRILEHIFLAQIRDEMMRKKVPLRLAELVASYPYHKGSPPDDGLLARPRFSTRRYDALHVRVETQLPDFTTPRPKQHPLRIIADAIKAEVVSDNGEYDSLWDAIKRTAAAISTESSEESITDTDGYPTLSRVFADETIRFLSVVPAESSGSTTPAIKLTSPPSSRLSRRTTRRRSSSLGAARNGNATGNGTNHSKGATSTENVVPPKDWSDFSSTGFGESSLGSDFAKTLLDTDLEVTQPRLVSRKSSKKRKASPPARSGRSSTEHFPQRNVETGKLKTTGVSLTKLDEAFIDFWSDALLDPISADWPNFVVCQLKPLPGVEVDGKSVNWLVVEQVYTRPPPPPEPQPASPMTPNRASSPRPSLRSNISATRKSATFAASRKRFTFFSPSQQTIGEDGKAASRRKSTMSPKVGEMGEILPDVSESRLTSFPTKKAKTEEPKGLGLTGVEVGAGVAAAGAAVAEAGSTQIKTSDLPAVPIVEAEQPSNVVEGIAATAPIKEEELSAEKPTPSIPQDVVVPTDAPTSEAEGADEAKPLPPAPEQVVLAGETPGPQVALSTSEPAAMAEVSSQVHIESANAAEGATSDVLQEGEQETSPVVPDLQHTVATSAPSLDSAELPNGAVSDIPQTETASSSEEQAVDGSVPEDTTDEDQTPNGSPSGASNGPDMQSRFVEDLASDSEQETVAPGATVMSATAISPIPEGDPIARDTTESSVKELPADENMEDGEKDEKDEAAESVARSAVPQQISQVQPEEELSARVAISEEHQSAVQDSVSVPVQEESVVVEQAPSDVPDDIRTGSENDLVEGKSTLDQTPVIAGEAAVILDIQTDTAAGEANAAPSEVLDSRDIPSEPLVKENEDVGEMEGRQQPVATQ